jgi:hypothetical protein
VGAAAAAESRRRRILWGCVATVLVVGPVAFTLARAPDFRASVELFPRAVAPYPAVDDPAPYLRLLDDPELQRQMTLNADAGFRQYRDASLVARPGGRLVLTVAAERPRRAALLVNALAPQIAVASARRLAAQAHRDVPAARASFRAARPGSRLRRRRLERLRALEALEAAPLEAVVVGNRARPPRLERWADQLADELPGQFPGRPSPGWAGIAGLIVAATLWAAALVARPPRAAP